MPQEKFKLVPDRLFNIGVLEFQCCRFNLGSWSEIGLRPTMEDSEKIIHNLFIEPFESISYYAVFDGHGGPKCSEFLKDNLHNYIKQLLQKNQIIENWPRLLIKAFKICDKAFKSQFPEDSKCMGSVAIIVIIVENTLIVCNLGDSRAILSRDGNSVALSRDHKPDLQEESLRIEKNGGYVFFGRVQGKLAVSRAFGDYELKDFPFEDEIIGPLVSVKPEIGIFEINPFHDEFIIIGCDGLFEAYTNEELVSLVRKKISRMPLFEQDPQRVIRDVVAEAVIDQRTSDNVSAILIMLSGGIQ